MSSRSAPRRGFTLVEALVALAVGGVVLLGARMMLVQVADEGDRLLAMAANGDREANAERFLRALAGRLEIGTEPAMDFSGDEGAARFTTWCDMAAGWQERCRVAILVDSLDGRSTIWAVLSTGEIVPLYDGFRHATLRYLSDAQAGGTWFRSWGRSITAPLALGVIIDGDTLIVRIGERG